MLFYENTGNGKPLVFLHGFLESHLIWNNLRKNLEKEVQIITIDLPGHGNSENSQEVNTMEEMAEKVIIVLDELNLEKATFIGHSMGGYVACALAELFPERVENIVLINSSTLPDDEAKKNQRLKACETARKNFNALVSFSMPALFAAHHRDQFKDELKFVKEIALETPIEGVCAALKGMRERPDRSSILYDFKGGIYIIVGMNDETVNPELFLTLIPDLPNIHLYKFDGGHMAFIENYDEVLSILKSI
ncbi:MULTISPECIES: alpha/beta fold hydrolase [unclassified Empedobacter]|uniref:alpha/beta fold hydrolase n=1 Tax=Empedobacter TaxID=59734 RepID=UPI0025777E8F|nr:MULTISPECIES: alpha/beta hydrolase [unclassified Empedobacter]MDM1138165.1 alpha/beta hydrolase [Empedobacter sp. R132-2]